MRRSVERRQLLAALTLSLGLAGLTIWAVARQGQALAAYEWAELRHEAAAAVAERDGALRAGASRALDVAALALEAAGEDGLDAWVAGQREWFLAAWRGRDGAWVTFPQPPLAETLPQTPPAAAATEPAVNGLPGLLRQLRDLTQSPETLRRAAALLASASEQQVGHPLAAARIFAEAAQMLRSTPGLARFAFRAELSRVEALLAAGDPERAAAALGALVATLLADHPARLSPAEAARLQRSGRELGRTLEAAVARDLAELERRAARRAELVLALEAALATVTGDGPRDALTAVTRSGDTLVVAVRRGGGAASVAVATPVEELLRRYWEPVPRGARWELRRARAAERPETLARLAPPLADYELGPSAGAAAARRAAAWRRGALLGATAVGTLAAWGLVLWALLRALAQQRELMRLQARFVADVSHELKTPLALIRMLAETLAAQRLRDPQRAQNYLETITRESERLTALLDTILDFSRIESGKRAYTRARVDVAAVARQAWALFEPRLTTEGFEARLEIAPDLPPVLGDAQALQQVLVNLLQNAYRYGGSGRYVRLRVAAEGHLVLLSVEDRGIGLRPEELERLGDSFFRGEAAAVRQTRGTGLGLTIVNHILAAHGGKLEVRSQPGCGSTFTAWIPAASDAAPAAD